MASQEWLSHPEQSQVSREELNFSPARKTVHIANPTASDYSSHWRLALSFSWISQHDNRCLLSEDINDKHWTDLLSAIGNGCSKLSHISDSTRPGKNESIYHKNVTLLSKIDVVLQIPARVGMTVTIMLTVVSQGITLYDNAPKVSYVMVADIWQNACFTCTFAVLAEYCVVIYFMKWELSTKTSRVNDIMKVNLSRQLLKWTQFDESTRPSLRAGLTPRGTLRWRLSGARV